jgi:hypothetical protein
MSAVFSLQVLQPSGEKSLYRFHGLSLVSRCDLKIAAPDDRTGSITVVSDTKFGDVVLDWHWAGQYLVAHEVLRRIDLAKALDVL